MKKLSATLRRTPQKDIVLYMATPRKLRKLLPQLKISRKHFRSFKLELTDSNKLSELYIHKSISNDEALDWLSILDKDESETGFLYL